MKQTKISMQMLIIAIAAFSVISVSSCNKEAKTPPVQNNVQSNSDQFDESILAFTPVALWKFDSSFKESKQMLVGVRHAGVKFTSTARAKVGIAAFISNDSGYVTYASAGTALPNLTTGLSADFWVYASPKEGGAQCVFCIPQTGAFWPTQHVLLDGYNLAKGDTGFIKVMFKANKAIDYNERWFEAYNIPNFYNHWAHVQYAYNGATSKFTLKVNGVLYVNHALQYTDGTSTTLLGNINPNPGSHGVVVGAFQNRSDPALFGNPEVWMLPYKGRIDDLRIYDTAIF